MARNRELEFTVRRDGLMGRAKVRIGAVVTFDQIPFNDDADEVRTWKGLALSAVMDLRRYAHDIGPERRLVSAEAYEADALRLQNTLNE